MRSRKGGGFWNVRSRKCWFPALVRVREWQRSEHASGSKHRCGAWDCIRIISYLCNHSKHLETIYWILLIDIYIYQSHSIAFSLEWSKHIQRSNPKSHPKMLRNLMDFSWPHDPMAPSRRAQRLSSASNCKPVLVLEIQRFQRFPTRSSASILLEGRIILPKWYIRFMI